MVIQLAEIFYGQEEIFDKLVEKNSEIIYSFNNGTHNIIIPKNSEIHPKNDKIVMRDAEIHLMTSLELGEIDYLFIYRSVAYQFEGQGVKYLELPAEIDLSDTAHANTYEQVRVITSSGRTVSGKPIVYGVSIPRNAEKPELALEFIKMLLGETGRGIMESRGQRNITPAVCDERVQLPDAVKSYVESI
jgi:molybdate/tungstate transport system substrate-binding protein